MRHPSARGDGRGDLSPAAAPHWLLIGNSRWHWRAHPDAGGPGCWSEAAQTATGRLRQLGPQQLVAWAAVGRLPRPARPLLPTARRITAAAVPLGAVPPWLGVDRALAGWAAWRLGEGAPVLVADAGTALSLTRVDGDGRFAGGRLLAGVGLQLRSLHRATAALPPCASPDRADGLAHAAWPAATEAAMAVGVARGAAAALWSAARELEESALPTPQLWITGGDAELLAPLLAAQGQRWRLHPQLVLDALATLRPEPGP